MSGAITTSANNPGQRSAQTQSIQPTDGDASLGDDQTVNTDDYGMKQTAAEVLAASIFRFVKSAAVLGQSLQPSLEGADSRRYNYGSDIVSAGSIASAVNLQHDEEPSEASKDDIQLLRLRTRSQEVIIFPDMKYLCCVVHNLAESGHAR